MPVDITKIKELSCAFTGHREIKENFNLKLLEETVKRFIEEGITRFYCGMAIGFDMIAADVVLKEKEKNKNVELIACIPCPEQSKYFSPEDKEKYQRILSLCDGKEILSEHYYKGCMLTRDRYMVDSSDRVLAYLNHTEDGGTAYTVSYAEQKNKDIYIL